MNNCRCYIWIEAWKIGSRLQVVEVLNSATLPTCWGIFVDINKHILIAGLCGAAMRAVQKCLSWIGRSETKEWPHWISPCQGLISPGVGIGVYLIETAVLAPQPSQPYSLSVNKPLAVWYSASTSGRDDSVAVTHHETHAWRHVVFWKEGFFLINIFNENVAEFKSSLFLVSAFFSPNINHVWCLQ